MNAETLTKALGGRWHGGPGMARCPAHEDKTPSLSISDGDGGRLLTFCHAGCAPAAKIPKGKASQYRSEGHIHKLAERYMEKRQLKHLWQIWRGSRNPADLSFELGGEPEG